MIDFVSYCVSVVVELRFNLIQGTSSTIKLMHRFNVICLNLWDLHSQPDAHVIKEGSVQL